MRLIDADELKKKENMDYVKISTWDEDKQEFVLGTIAYISPDSVDRAKTVDAVPVSYIRKWIDSHPTDYTTVESMLTDWREEGEQGERHNSV